MSSLTSALKLKSKTVNYNALFLAIVAVSSALGYEVSAEIVAAVQTILNIVLRFFTSIPLADK